MDTNSHVNGQIVSFSVINRMELMTSQPVVKGYLPDVSNDLYHGQSEINASLSGVRRGVGRETGHAVVTIAQKLDSNDFQPLF